MHHFTLLIHGGAGNIHRKQLSQINKLAFYAALDSALAAGEAILSGGGKALDAVEASVCVLEDSPLFNAGRGSVFTASGMQEMDAAIMDGCERNAGAVACVQHIRNPVCAARTVLERSPHILLCGEGAERFAKSQNVECVDAEYFFDRHRWDQLMTVRGSPKLQLDFPNDNNQPESNKYGTVGAVACDSDGHVAAATSTGGLTNKYPGRIGDSAIIGAGIYADDLSCAVSCTGQGEFFMRGLIAADVANRMRYAHQSLTDSASGAIHKTLATLGGKGGLIAVDAHGNYSMCFNTTGMFRGASQSGGKRSIFMFGNEGM